MSQKRLIYGIHLRAPRQTSRCNGLQTRCAHVIGEQYVADERRRYVGSGLGDGVADAGQAFCIVAGPIPLEVYELDVGIGVGDL